MSIFSKRILPGGKAAAGAFFGAIVAAVGIQAQTDPSRLSSKSFWVQLGLIGAAGAYQAVTRPVTMSHDEAEVARDAIVTAKQDAATVAPGEVTPGVPSVLPPNSMATYTGPKP